VGGVRWDDLNHYIPGAPILAEQLLALKALKWYNVERKVGIRSDKRLIMARCQGIVTVLLGTSHYPIARCACHSYSSAPKVVELLNHPSSVPSLEIFAKSPRPTDDADFAGAQTIQDRLVGLL
jgi:hypothetical protein